MDNASAILYMWRGRDGGGVGVEEGTGEGRGWEGAGDREELGEGRKYGQQALAENLSRRCTSHYLSQTTTLNS